MVTINRRYDVPYLAGASKDGKTVYIDRRVPRKLAIKRRGGRGYVSVSLDPFLAVHEETEFGLMVSEKMPYAQAHAIATQAEKKAVEKAGLDWDYYEKVCDGLLSHIEHEKPRQAPPDLYTKPYSHDKQVLLNKIRARADGGAVDTSGQGKDQSRVPEGPLVPGLWKQPIPGSEPILQPGKFRDDGGPVTADQPPLDWIQVHSNAGAPLPGGTGDVTTSDPVVPSAAPAPPPGPPGPGGRALSSSIPDAKSPVPVSPDNQSGMNLNDYNGLTPAAPKSLINAQGQATAGPPVPGLEQGNNAAVAPVSGDSGAHKPTPDEIAAWERGENPPPSSPEPAPQGRSILDKLLGIGGPRYELWPERVVRSALTAPGETLATGQLSLTDPYGRVVGTQPVMDPANRGFPSDTAIQRSQDIAAMQFSGGALAVEEGAIGATGGRLPDNPRYLLPAVKVGNKIYKGIEGDEHNSILENLSLPQLEGLTGVKNSQLNQMSLGDWQKATGLPPDDFEYFKDSDDLVKQLMVLTNKSDFEQGFVDHRGRFLGYDQAGRYAVDNGLLSHDPKLEAAVNKDPGIFHAPMLKTEASKPGVALAAAEHSPFYSAVEQAIVNGKPTKMFPEQWIGWLKNQPGVKPEELQWIGLGDKSQLPADLQNGPITKDQLLAHVRENQTQLNMVEKRGEQGLSEDEIMAHAVDVMRRRFEHDYPYATPEEFEDYLHNSEQGDREFANIREAMQQNSAGQPRYSEYQLPGGSNYRETLLTLPLNKQTDPAIIHEQLAQIETQAINLDRNDPRRAELRNQARVLEEQLNSPQTAYQSSHWDEPNVLLHMRMNDREIPGVGKDLHLEELQSDWHQRGRQKGYQPKQIDTTGWTASHSPELGDRVWKVFNPEGRLIAHTSADNAQDAINGVTRDEELGVVGGIPDAPFKQTWPDLGLKTAIAKAAREGYSAISWTPGEQQAARYDLSKHVDKVWYQPSTGNLQAYDKSGAPVITRTQIKPEDLPNIIGKEAADKIMNKPTNMLGGTIHQLSGADLKVGGEGMKAFYDKMLVNKANALGKKYGAQVEWKEMPTKKPLNIEVRPSGNGWATYADGHRTGFISNLIGGGALTHEEALQIARQGAENSFVARSRSRGEQTIKVPVLRLTPKLKEAALKGMPLYSTAGTVAAPTSQQPQNRKSGGRVNHNPTTGQRDAGNYSKRHVTVHGLDISIENEKGSTRRGIGKNGKPWACVLPAAYGYFKRSVAADGEHVDVYLGPHKTSRKVFIIDQIDADTGKPDEAKVFLCFGSKAQVIALYKKAFSDGKGMDRLGAIHEMALPDFKVWLKNPDQTTKPIRKIKRDAFGYHENARKDRCGNCKYTSGTNNGCGLFRMINQRIPDDFDLDPDVKPGGWCTAWTPR